jgi:Ca2+-dependent lipid-binding protein
VSFVWKLLTVRLNTNCWVQVEKQGRTREHRWIRHEERRKAHMTRLDDGETVRWLNQAIVSIWPVCLESFASQQFLMPLVPWFLAKYKPSFVKEVLLQKLHLGNRAPVFTLIRALDQQREGDQLVLPVVSLNSLLKIPEYCF